MVEKIAYKISEDHLEDMIYKYCRDFTALDRAGRYDPITGRDEELDQVILILLQKGRKNAALLAPAGVGKTALVVGLAQQINKGNVPDFFKNARVLELELASMAAGTSGPSEFQERLIPLCRGIAERYHDKDRPRTILFIDEMHTIMPSCEGSAYRGLSEVLKPWLTVGDLQVIGATTLDEFRIYMQVDPAMDRRFQKVLLPVPDVMATISILQKLKGGYESHHGIAVDDSAIEAIVKCTEDHMRKRNQPDKSIIMMDAAMAHHVKLHGRGGRLSHDSIYTMISKEIGVHPEALRIKHTLYPPADRS
jgi:ATP-dependent Clp protease ATP-binding subunit ClpA